MQERKKPYKKIKREDMDVPKVESNRSKSG